MNGAISNPDSVRTMFAHIASRYDRANHLLSGGMDFLWRRRVVRIVRDWCPSQILDLATGSGDLALALARALPLAHVVAADFCPPMLEEARKKGVRNLVVADAMNLPFEDESFDLVTVAFGLRNMESWPTALGEMRRVLRPGGHLLVLDFSMPTGLLRPLYRAYLHRVLPHLATWLTGRRAAYEYLAGSIEKFPCGDAMGALFRGAKLRDVRCEPLTGGIVSIYTASRG